MNHAKKGNALGIFIVMACGCMWGAGGVFAQMFLTLGEADVYWVSSIRMLLTGIALMCWVLFKKGKQTFQVWKNPSARLRLLFFSVCGVLAVQFTYFAAIAASNAATGTVLQYTYPILILVYSALIAKKVPAKIEIIAILLAFAGIVMIATHGNLQTLQATKIAVFWGLLSAVTFVIFTVAPKKLYEEYSLIEINAWGFFLAGLIFSIGSGSLWKPVHLSGTSILLIIAITLCGTLIPFVLYGKGVQMLGPVKASLFVTIEPVMSAVLTCLLTNVQFVTLDYLGFIAILGAVQIVAFAGKKTSKTPEAGS